MPEEARSKFMAPANYREVMLQRMQAIALANLETMQGTTPVQREAEIDQRLEALDAKGGKSHLFDRLDLDKGNPQGSPTSPLLSILPLSVADSKH